MEWIVVNRIKRVVKRNPFYKNELRCCPNYIDRGMYKRSLRSYGLF